MLHYTLLPKEEMKSLRTEYRIRALIVALFFISISIIVGILALFPSYTTSRIQEDSVASQTNEIQKKREASGAVEIEKDLVQSQAISEKILANEGGMPFSDGIQRIVSHRMSGVFIGSLDISYDKGTSTPMIAIIQGKAATREALIDFKKTLEMDKSFSKVELPISDLAKSKDISFALRAMLKR